MKILFTYIGFIPAYAWGGPVKVIHENARELQRRGHQVTVCCTNLLNKSEHLHPQAYLDEVDGIQVKHVSAYAIAQWPGSTGPYWISLSGLRLLFREIRQADVVHINGFRGTLELAATIFARLLRRPRIVQPHGTLPRILNTVFLKWLFDRVLGGVIIAGADALIAVQSSERQQIMAAGGAQSHIHIVPNAMATDEQTPPSTGQFRRRYGIPDDHQVVLFLGRINRKKGTDLLVQAFAQLPNRQNMTLVIAGPDDGQLAEVQRLIREVGIEQQTRLTGLLQGEEVAHAYGDADVFVLPCRVDTFPMAIIEACRSGVPIVTTTTCEIADKVDEIAGKVVPAEANALATAIAEILENKALHEKYRTGGQALLNTEFSIETVGNKLETIYQESLKARQSVNI